MVADKNNPNTVLIAYVDETYQAPYGFLISRSTDGGTTWSNNPFRDNINGLQPVNYNIRMAEDDFGNLYMVYVSNSSTHNIIVARSTDFGLTWTGIATLQEGDLPNITIAADPSNPSRDLIWVSAGGFSPMFAAWATSISLGQTSIFTTTTVNDEPSLMPNSGNLAIGPAGQVGAVWMETRNQTNGSGNLPNNIRYQLDADGIGSGAFTSETVVTSTNFGMNALIPATEESLYNFGYAYGEGTNVATLLWDRVRNREYLLYTDILNKTGGSGPGVANDTDIELRHSDDGGNTWSNPVKVNDDTGNNSQFKPAISLDAGSGNLMVCWYDCRNDDGTGLGSQTTAGANNEAQWYGAISTDGGITFSPNVAIAPKLSSGGRVTSTLVPYGDYEDVFLIGNTAYTVWSDNSNSTGDNPDPNNEDIYFSKITVNPPPTPKLSSAVSRFTVGGTNLDLPLNLTGAATIEDRVATGSRTYQIVLNYSGAIGNSPSATLGLQTGQKGTVVGTAGTPVVSGSTAIVTLGGVANAQRLNLHLSGIQPGNGTADVPLNILWGDVNDDGTVNILDLGQVRQQSGVPVTPANLRNDVNADGALNILDLGQVRSLSGTSLP